jgi:hypothetical protein
MQIGQEVNPETVGLIGGIILLLIALVGGGIDVRGFKIPKVPKMDKNHIRYLGLLFSLPFFVAVVHGQVGTDLAPSTPKP